MVKDKERLSKILAPLFIILAGACWGVIGLFTKQLSAAGCTAAQIAFLRCSVSAVLLWLFLAVFDRDKLKIRIKDVWMFIGTGVLSLVCFSVMYFTCQQYTGLSVASVLLYTAPCFVLIMSSIFFREKITAKKTIALIIAFVGCICTTGLMEALIGGMGLGQISTIGILTGIGSGIGYALYSIFGNVALRRYSSVTVTAYTFLFAALALFPFCANKDIITILSAPSAIWSTLLIAVISTLLPYLLYTLGLSHTEPGKASVMAFSEPMVATLTGVIVFNEVLTPGAIMGILLIFTSIVVLNTNFVRKKRTLC